MSRFVPIRLADGQRHLPRQCYHELNTGTLYCSSSLLLIGSLNAVMFHAWCVIQVVRARNVPFRRLSGDDAALPARGGSPARPSSPNRPSSPSTASTASTTIISYVQLSFQNKIARTSAHAGVAPQWNQVLTLPFKAPSGDYSAAALSNITDHIQISLFDEVTTNFTRDDRDRHTTVTQKEARYLGCVRIPFTSLYQAGHIEGEFR